jgi:hypothetical protein
LVVSSTDALRGSFMAVEAWFLTSQEFFVSVTVAGRIE